MGTYTTNKFLYKPPWTSASAEMTAFASGLDRVDAQLRGIINVQGFYDSATSAWMGATGDGSTDDSTVINAAIVECKTRYPDYGIVLFPPTENGYAIGTSIQKYGNVALAGRGTKLVGAAGLSVSMIEFVDDHQLVFDSANHPIYIPAISGFLMDGSSISASIDFIRAKDITMRGVVIEKIHFYGSSSVAHSGIHFFGGGAKHRMRFSGIQFYKCHATYGAFSFVNDITNQGNEITIEKFNFTYCKFPILIVYSEPVTIRDSVIDILSSGSGGSPITQTNGNITGGLFPRIKLINAQANISDCYFDSTSGQIVVWNETVSTVQSSATVYKNCVGLEKNQIFYCRNRYIFNDYDFGLTRIDASNYSISGNWTGIWSVGDTIYGYNGSEWASMGTISAIDYSVTTTNYTTVTMSSTVPEGLSKVTEDKLSAVSYVSTTQLATQTGASTSDTVYHGNQLLLLKSTGIIHAKADYFSSDNIYLMDANATSGISEIRSFAPPGEYLLSNEQKLNTYTDSWVTPNLHHGNHVVVNLATIAANVMIFLPSSLYSSFSQEFTIEIIGHASNEYYVCWAYKLISKITSVPAGWRSLSRFFWNGSYAMPINEELFYQGTSAAKNYGAIDDGASDNSLTAAVTGALVTDTVSASFYDTLGQRYKFQMTAAVTEADLVTFTITNRDGDTRDLGAAGYAYFIVRRVISG